MTIKTLVLSGGGPNGLLTVGFLHALIKNEFISNKDIDKYYGTSVGAFIALLCCINYDFNHITDFIIKRPWEKVANIESDDILEIITGGGFMDKFNSLLKTEMFLKLLEAQDCTENTTFSELYQKTNKELYMYTIDIQSFEMIELSHKSHPDLPIIQGLMMSAALPPFIRPIEYENKYYMDGGVLENYPLTRCLTNTESPDEILGINIIKDESNKFVVEDSNVLTYALYVINKMWKKLLIEDTQSSIKNQVNIITNTSCVSSPGLWKDFFNSRDYRQKLYDQGFNEAIEFLKKNNYNVIDS